MQIRVLKQHFRPEIFSYVCRDYGIISHFYSLVFANRYVFR